MNEQLLLDLLKQDAFVMEVASYKDPWLPENDEVITEVYKSFANDMAELLGADFFAAMVIDELPLLGRGMALLSVGTSVSCISLEGRSPTIEWLWDEAQAGATQDSPSQIRQWRQNAGQSADFFFVPYIVQPLSLIGFPPTVESARTFYQSMTKGDRNKFLYTEPELVSTCQSSFPFPRNGYYKAAWLIGITGFTPKKAFQLIHNIEAFSILFHMSWGYPELLREKAKAAEEKAKQDEREKLLSHLQRASKLAMSLATDVYTAYSVSVQLQDMLFPRVKGLFNKYRNAADYIPIDETKDGGEPYHENDNWKFRHGWTEDLITSNPEAFRAQVSCILLKFFAYRGIGPHNLPWPNDLELPWVLLAKYSSQIIDRFGSSFALTVDKITKADESTDWERNDVKSFNFLKGCFHYPFKDLRHQKRTGDFVTPSPLTGPLLLLWASEHGGMESIGMDSRDFLSRSYPTKGDGWPSKYFLSALHGLYEYAKDDSNLCTLKVTSNVVPETRQLAVKVALSSCGKDFIKGLKRICDAVAATYASDLTPYPPLNELDNRLGSLPGYIDIVYSHKGAKPEFEGDSTLIIQFEVKMSG
jgi:hypothetical protein